MPLNYLRNIYTKSYTLSRIYISLNLPNQKGLQIADPAVSQNPQIKWYNDGLKWNQLPWFLILQFTIQFWYVLKYRNVLKYYFVDTTILAIFIFIYSGWTVEQFIFDDIKHLYQTFLCKLKML